jgi:hypothetical protein
MGWFFTVLAGVAAWSLWDNGAIRYVAITVAVLCFWSHGVMHNYATEAKARAQRHDGNPDFAGKELDAVPGWITAINVLAVLGALGMFITGLFLK